MISRYLFTGSRRKNRRKSDPQTCYYVDRPCRELMILAGVVILLGILDAYFTYRLLEAGGAEINPLIDMCLKQGWGYCLTLKFGLTIAGVFVLVAHQNFLKITHILSGVGAFYGLLIAYQLLLLLRV